MRIQQSRQVFRISGFGGVCQTGVTDRIPPNMLADALNYLLTRDRELMPRPGFELFADDGTANGLAILKIFPADMDGSLRYLIGTNSTIYDYNPATDAWASVYTIAEADRNGRPSLALINPATNPTVVFGNGKMHPQKATFSTGTGLWTVSATGSDTPHGRPIAHKNYVVMWGISGFPGRVQIAWYPGDPDTWIVGAVIHNLEMRGTVTGAFPFANGIVIYSAYRSDFFIGDPGNPTGMESLSESVGCVAHEGIADCDGLLVWPSQGGVMAWTGGGGYPTANLSSPDDPAASSIARDYDRITWTDLASINAVFYPAERLYLLSAKIQSVAAGDASWRTWVFDFKAKGWMPWTTEGTAWAAVVDPTTGRQRLLNGTTAGALRTWSTGTFIDYDVPIGLAAAVNTTYPYWFASPDLHLGLPDMVKDFRAVVLSSTGKYKGLQPGNRQVKIYFRGEFERFSTDQITLTSAAGGFVLDVDQVDVDELGESERFVELPQPIALRAKHLNWYVFGSGDANALPISQIAIEWRTYARRRTILISR